MINSQNWLIITEVCSENLQKSSKILEEKILGTPKYFYFSDLFKSTKFSSVNFANSNGFSHCIFFNKTRCEFFSKVFFKFSDCLRVHWRETVAGEKFEFTISWPGQKVKIEIQLWRSFDFEWLNRAVS